tara:strand:- start:496 stop:732 length:237 start_codon:yes stop_codon:yes gene_type:complete
MKVFGKSEEEEEIHERAKAREICQVILEYGINQNQIKHLIYLLSLELEDIQLMQTITQTIKSYKQDLSPKILTGEKNE